MADVPRIKVSLFWDGQIIFEENNLRYDSSPKYHVKFPLDLKFSKLLQALYNRLQISRSDFDLNIIGKYPTSFTPQGVTSYGQW